VLDSNPPPYCWGNTFFRPRRSHSWWLWSVVLPRRVWEHTFHSINLVLVFVTVVLGSASKVDLVDADCFTMGPQLSHQQLSYVMEINGLEISHSYTFRLVAIIRYIHGIPATSVTCERLSTAGVTVSDLRSSLLPQLSLWIILAPCSMFTTIEYWISPAQLNVGHLADNICTQIPCQLSPMHVYRHDSTQLNPVGSWLELSLTDIWWAYNSLMTRSRRRPTANDRFDVSKHV